MSSKLSFRPLGYFIIFSGTFSIPCFGHTGHDHSDRHAQDDAILAQQARQQEAEPSYLLDQWQQKLTYSISAFSRTMLSDIINSATAASGSPATVGQWGAVVKWPFVFASAANLPDGRILAWGGNSTTSFSGGIFTYASAWNPTTGQFTTANHASHSLFCGIPVMLEDGRVFVSGGDQGNASSVKGTSTFNFKSNTWTRIQDMAVGRWYNGSVALPSGQVFTAIGVPGSAYPEIWNQSSGWSYLNNASLQSAILDYPNVTEAINGLPHLHLTPNGRIFHSGHTPQMHFIDTANNGNVQPVSISNDWNTANTPSVLWDEGKILQAGGATYDANNTSSGKAAIIDFNNNVPTRTVINSMQYPRIFHNQVVLPNGEVMVIGGNSSGLKFNDTGTQYTPEIWNPITKAWRAVADHQVPRNYHSVALLMTDGRVWSGGGGLCNCAADHPDAQVYSPPYLFNTDGSLATRPVINNAPTVASYGTTLNITASADITKFTLIRMSSTTHALNSDMRLLNVPFSTTATGQYDLQLHSNRNVMTPGYWMLFALNNNGVPSVAKILQITTSNAPILQNISDQTSIVNGNTSLSLSANDPNGDRLTFDAIGLPNGLVIDPNTGTITGTPTSTGTYRVVVSVSDNTNVVSSNFVWTITSNQISMTSSIFGATSGTTFSDSISVTQSLTGINVRAGSWLDAIQGVLNTGNLTQHGGTGGNLTTVTWPSNEYLVRIYGTYGNYIGQISFVTNTGRTFGPYGAGGGNNTYNYDYTVPSGYEITGFTGRSSAYLNALGVIYRLKQVKNQPPLLTTVANQANAVGDTVNIPIKATDPEGDAITFSAVGLPPGLLIAANTGVISGTVTAAANYDTIVKAIDARGASSVLNFTWTIAPKPFIINPLNTSPNPINTDINLTASVSNAINPQFKWSFGDGSPETAYTTSGSVNHAYTAPGLYVVRVTVMDDSGLTNTKTFIQAIHLPQTAEKPAASSNIIVTPNSKRIWVVNQDNNTVSVFNESTSTKIAEIAVGKSPRAIALAPDGRVWVTNKDDATISIIDPTLLQTQKTIALPYASQPFGLVFAPNDSAAYVALEAIGKLAKLNPSTGEQLAVMDVGPTPRHISVQADSSKILVPRFITRSLPGEATAFVQTTENQSNRGGEVVVVDTATMTINKTIILAHSDKQDTETQGSGLPNYLASPVISPDGKTAWVPSKQDNIKRGVLRNGSNLTFQNTVRAIGSKIDLTSLAENYGARLDFDNSGMASAALFDAYGNYLFVALENTREVAVVDAYGGRELTRINVGLAPDGLALSSNGKTLYVTNFMDRSLSMIDLSNVFSRGDWNAPVFGQLSTVSTEKLAATVLKGKQLFYDAKDIRLARDGYLSCSACHSEGGHDGRVWDLSGFGEGLRNTIDLRGRAGTGQGLLHWSANFDEIQDFEGQIRNLSGGTGLMTDVDFSTTQDTLGPRKTGKSTDLDALASYVSSLQSFAASPQRNADTTLTTNAQTGKVLFTSSGCIKCHGGDQFTDSSFGVVHDIGTIKPSSGKRLNGLLSGIDTPTLRDVWNTAPYLHDGSAATLNNAIKAHNTVTLNDADIAQVATYVQQIGGTETAPANIAPNISLTTPTNGNTITQGAVINLSANADDTDGSIVKVEFYDGSNLLGSTTAVPYSFSWIPTTGIHTVTAKAYDNYGAIGTSNSINITISPAANGTGEGLLGQYYNNIALTGSPVLSRQDTINFDWGVGSPAPTVNVDNFSVRWTGQIEAPTTGTYQFQTLTDDGVRLTINGQQVINNWTDHSPTTDTTTSISLVAGTKYQIVMEFYELGGGATSKLSWKTPGQTTFSIIPKERLYSSLNGLVGQYFNNITLTGTPVLTRLENVNFDWDINSPAPVVTVDNFSVRWTGSVKVATTGIYQFQTISDDGVRLTINGQQVINNWTDHSPTTNTTTSISLVAGTKYQIVMEFYERSGGATAKLLWKAPGQTTFSTIPIDNLFSN